MRYNPPIGPLTLITFEIVNQPAFTQRPRLVDRDIQYSEHLFQLAEFEHQGLRLIFKRCAGVAHNHGVEGSPKRLQPQVVVNATVR